MWKEISKAFGIVMKRFEGFNDAVKDTFFFMIGLSVDSGKVAKPEKGMRAYLFIWPFAIALVIVLYLFASVFFVS